MDLYEQRIADQEAFEKFSDEIRLPEGIEPSTDEKLDELLQILRPLAPFIAALPEMMQKVDPLIEGAKKSPVLRMMGITIP